MTREKALEWFEKRTLAVTMSGERAATDADFRAITPPAFAKSFFEANP